MIEDLKQQLIVSWFKNNNSNILLLDMINSDAYDYTISPRGGGKVGYQLNHIYNVRFWKLEAIQKKLVQNYKTIKADEVFDKVKLYALYIETGNLFEQIIEESFKNEGKVKTDKVGIISLITGLIAHEAHHRGNILLTLKNSPYKLKQEQKHQLWSWNSL